MSSLRKENVNFDAEHFPGHSSLSLNVVIISQLIENDNLIQLSAQELQVEVKRLFINISLKRKERKTFPFSRIG